MLLFKIYLNGVAATYVIKTKLFQVGLFEGVPSFPALQSLGQIKVILKQLLTRH